jgi:hypothetical protein
VNIVRLSMTLKISRALNEGPRAVLDTGGTTSGGVVD